MLGAFYGCNVIVIEETYRRQMLGVLEHELFHAHQDETIIPGGICPQRKFYERWAATEDGQDWIAATEADREAGRIVAWIDDPDSYFWTIPAESAAEYYSYWIRAAWPFPGELGPDVGNLCFKGQSERCKWMEKRFGPRPQSYP